MYPNELTRLAENSGWDIFSPEWDFWRQCPTQSVMACCALSVGLDPVFGDLNWTIGTASRIRADLYPPPLPLSAQVARVPGLMELMLHGDAALRRGERYDAHVRARFHDVATRLDVFERRVQITTENLAPLGDIPVVPGPQGGARIRLSDFADIAQRLGWALPSEFPRVEAVFVLPAPDAAQQQPLDAVLSESRAETATEGTPPAGAVASTTVVRHSLSGGRSVPLRAEIEEAKKRAGENSDDLQSVWSELVKLAQLSPPFGALAGCSSDGVQYRGVRYERDGGFDVLTRKNLKDRLYRERKGRAKTR